MAVYSWSQTAANNATADSTINWREGQAPSSVNDSARAMMAAVAAYRDDISGKLASTGTSTAFVLATNQNLGTTPIDGFQLSFRPRLTNGSSPKITVDGLTQMPLCYAPATYIPAGFFVPYVVYNITLFTQYNEWHVSNVPSTIMSPVLTGVVQDYLGTTAPDGYVMLSGRTIGSAASPATERSNADTLNLYSLLWSSIPSLYVSGGGRGASAAADFAANKTIALPDARGKALIGLDNMGGSAAGLITNFSGVTLGAWGGEQNHTLVAAENGVHAHTVTDNGHTHNISKTSNSGGGGGGTQFGGGGTQYNTDLGYAGIAVNNSVGGSPHNNLQPSMMTNKICKL